MRIIGGTARGLHLSPVGEGDAKAHLRPTSDMNVMPRAMIPTSIKSEV